jgi:DNA processing protein
MFEDKNKRESLYHAALLYAGFLKIGSTSLKKDGTLTEKFEPEKKLKELLQQHGSFEAIFKSQSLISIEDTLNAVKGLDSVARKLRNLGFEFKIITVNDEAYPKGLRDVEGTSPVIYARGDLSILERKSIAVVGTRKLYKQNIVAAIEEGAAAVKRIVDAGFVVLSGLAEGCDTLAHKRAIEYAGKTIAVLGTPLDRYYPPSNGPLQERIGKEHLLVSQYPIGIRSFGSYFAHRNKTAASLASDGVMVIHSDDESGTQYAIRHCKNQGKKLYILENNLHHGYEWVVRAASYPNSRIVRKNRADGGEQ